jgi:acyl-coenzyme A thioesterase PaaI-like protein
VVREGSRIAVAHTELHNDAGELIATGSAAYLIG